jgi:hypothetical protein
MITRTATALDLRRVPAPVETYYPPEKEATPLAGTMQ